MRKTLLIKNLLAVLPKIIGRTVLFTIKKKEFLFNEFRPTNIVCIDGTLNQLVWHLENPIFLSISNSPKIYFTSDEFVFNVSKIETEFILKAYTLKGVKKYKASTKVLCLSQKPFDGLSLTENMVKLRKKALKLKENEQISNKLSKVRNTKLSRINVPIRSKITMVNRFENDRLNSILGSISKSNNKKELTQLKQEL